MSKAIHDKLQAEAAILFKAVKASTSQTDQNLEILKADTEVIRIAIILAMQDPEMPDDKILALTTMFQKKLNTKEVESQIYSEVPDELKGQGNSVNDSVKYEKEDLSEHFFSLGEFTHAICFDQKFGYYSQISNNLGFSTIANNEAQFGFAMSLIAKAMNHWIDHERPNKFAMMQLSGGNGELDLVILSIVRIMAEKSGEGSIWKQFYDALNFVTIDISPSLSAHQQKMCQRYEEKYSVIHGDATLQESWDKVHKELGCEAYFGFSNELLDMLFGEYYTLFGKGQQEIAQAFVVTKIKIFDEFSKKIIGLIGDNIELKEEFQKVFSSIKSDSSLTTFNIEKKASEVFVDKKNYKQLMTLMLNPAIREIKELDQYFEHSVIEFSLNLTKPQCEALAVQLKMEDKYYTPIEGQKHFYTQNEKISSLLSLKLPNQLVFHYDYYGKNPQDPTQQGLCILRHHAAEKEIEQDSSFMVFDKDGGIKLKHGMPNRYDTTQTVKITHQMNVHNHDEFISDRDGKHIDQITKVFGLNIKNFVSQSLESDLGFFKAGGLSKTIAPSSSASVMGEQQKLL